MAAELGLVLAQQQNQPATWKWRRPAGAEDDADSWEARAFARDSGAIPMWPPRSYTCSFCRREFRSAQALGGHMNVHRRDRARLRQSGDQGATSAVPVAVPPRDFMSGGGLCLFYSMPSPGAVSTQTVEREVLDLLPMGEGEGRHGGGDDRRDGMVVDEIDLELRLGW